MKKIAVNIIMTIISVIVFALAPVTIADAQRTQKPATSTSSGDRVKDGLDSIKETFPETVVDKDASPEGLAKKIIDIALYVSAIVAVIFIIIGGYYYITAGGNDEQAKNGRKTLVNALIGLTLVVLSYIIVQVAYRFLTDQS